MSNQWLLKLIFSVTRKVANYFSEVLEEKQDKVLENLQVNGSR